MEKKKFYFLYQTTNLINSKIYIGMHTTFNLNDGYLGSGKIIKRAIEKYGRENFKRNILFLCSSKEELVSLEKKYVTEDFLSENKDRIYNLTRGGGGGFAYINKMGLGVPIYLQKVDTVARNKKAIESKRKKMSDPIFRNVVGSIIRKRVLEYYDSRNHVGHMKGKLLSEESKRKIGINSALCQKGEGNSQYGKCWVFNSVFKESKRIKKEELNIWLSQGWLKGRKIVRRDARVW